MLWMTVAFDRTKVYSMVTFFLHGVYILEHDGYSYCPLALRGTQHAPMPTSTI